LLISAQVVRFCALAQCNRYRTGLCAGYDEEARYFEDTVRRAKQEELVARAQQMVAPAFAQQLGHLRDAALARVVAALAQPKSAQPSFVACASRCAQPCKDAPPTRLMLQPMAKFPHSHWVFEASVKGSLAKLSAQLSSG